MVVELWVALYAVKGVFGTQEVAVLGQEFTGDGVAGFGSRQETTDSGSKGTIPVALNPDCTLFGVIEALNASTNASKKSSF